MNIKYLALALCVTVLAACGTLKPHTISNAVVGHQTFPGLSIAVQECVADHPEVRAEILDPWNRLFDKWKAAGDLKPDASIVVALANAQSEMAEAEADAVFVEAAIINAGLDCGPFVRKAWGNIKVTFSELKTAVTSNQRIVEAIEWATLLAGIVQGRKGEVVRMAE